MNSRECYWCGRVFDPTLSSSPKPPSFIPQWLALSSSVVVSQVSLLPTLSSSEVQMSSSSTNNRVSFPSSLPDTAFSHYLTPRFMGGNSTKATSGINGAGTQSQQDLGIQDSSRIFFEDTKKSVRVSHSHVVSSSLNPFIGS